jgi:hypothetical protein
LTEIRGISVADHIGRSVRETVPQVADQVEKIVELILSNGEPITGVGVKGQRPDGINAERFWLTSWQFAKNRSFDGASVARRPPAVFDHVKEAIEMLIESCRFLQIEGMAVFGITIRPAVEIIRFINSAGSRAGLSPPFHSDFAPGDWTKPLPGRH